MVEVLHEVFLLCLVTRRLALDQPCRSHGSTVMMSFIIANLSWNLTLGYGGRKKGIRHLQGKLIEGAYVIVRIRGFFRG